MCGIVGLFAKDAALEAELGAHLATMLASLGDRGPDSAGFAVYAPPVAGSVKLTLRGPAGYDFAALGASLRGRLPGPVGLQQRGTHAVLAVPDTRRTAAARAGADRPELTVVGVGHRMELYKEVGLPADVAQPVRTGADAGNSRHRPHAHGDRIRGHHRRRASVFHRPGPVPGAQRLACPTTMRCAANCGGCGYGFATENDTEVAAVYLTAQLRDGAVA